MTDFKSVLYKLIGKRVKELRKAKDLSQEDLAKAVQVTRSTIANIETGRHQPPIHLLYSVFYTLGSNIHMELPTYDIVMKEVHENSPIELETELKEKLPEGAKGHFEELWKILKKEKPD